MEKKNTTVEVPQNNISQQSSNISAEHEVSQQERSDAMAAYFMMFASSVFGFIFPLINIIASLIYYAATDVKKRFVKFHAHQSLLSQIPVSIINSTFVIWVIVRFIRTLIFISRQETFVYGSQSDYPSEWTWSYFFPSYLAIQTFWLIVTIIIAINLFYLIFSVVAALQANNGKIYKMPFIGNISYNHIYKN